MLRFSVPVATRLAAVPGWFGNGMYGSTRCACGRQVRLRNDVARVHLAGEGIPDGAAELGEVASPHLFGEHRMNVGACDSFANAFVRHHEERLVVPVVDLRQHHGTVGREPELVVATRIRRLGAVLEVPPRVEGIVLEELEDRSVQLVGAALGHDVHVDAEVRAVLGGGAAGLDLHLGDRVRDRTHGGLGREVGRGIDAVQRQAVLECALSGAGKAVGAAEHARRRAGQGPHVASVAERRLRDQPLIDRFGDRWRCRCRGRSLRPRRQPFHSRRRPAATRPAARPGCRGPRCR